MDTAKTWAIIGLAWALAACGGSSAPAPANIAPVALAGAAQSVQLGAAITLDGSASSDSNGDALSYSWTLNAKPAGSNAVLTGGGTAHPTMTPDLGGSYSASLVVSDGKLSSSATTVTLTVVPPTDPHYVLGGGGASTVAVGTTASVGTPPWNLANGDTLTYAWTLASKPAGSSAVLTAAGTAQAGLVPDLPGSYVATLVVSDGKRLSMPASTTVNAMDGSAFKDFVDLVNGPGCNNFASDLYLIDGKYVFAWVAGGCYDASYAAALYGLTPTPLLCGVYDSLFGPQSDCPDANAKALFDTIYANRNVNDLGLGGSHQVSKFIKPAPVPAGATAVNVTVIDQGITRYLATATNTAIVRNNADWSALWLAHRGTPDTPLLPPVDFGKKIVLALFYPQLTSCAVTGVTRAYILDGKLVVEYGTRYTGRPDTFCTTIAYAAAELVSIDIPATPGLPIEFQQKKLSF